MDDDKRRKRPDEPYRGPNMYGQQGQSNKGSTHFPHAGGAPSDGDWSGKRSKITRGMRRGDGSGGYE